MACKAMILASDSHNPAAPLFAVYDSISNTWYELDSDLWADVALQADDPDEFAFFCAGCLKPLNECTCSMGR